MTPRGLVERYIVVNLEFRKSVLRDSLLRALAILAYLYGFMGEAVSCRLFPLSWERAGTAWKMISW